MEMNYCFGIKTRASCCAYNTQLVLWVIFHDTAALSIYYMVSLMMLSPKLMHKHIMEEQYKLQCFI